MNGLPADPAFARIIPDLRRRLPRDARTSKGRIQRMVGPMIHATVEHASLGEICTLTDATSGRAIRAEVVGLVEGLAHLLPLGDLTGLSKLSHVVCTGAPLKVPVGPGLLGRVVDAFGEPLDGMPHIAQECDCHRPLRAEPMQPLSRAPVSDPMQLGIRALDGLLTLARGQRVGIFGEPGVGKSLLLTDIVRDTDADVVVVGLVGERGREVREFVERQRAGNGMHRTVVVAATSDRPAIERLNAAYLATTIAEYFRDQGKHVLLTIDNITRFARAIRETSLASGEALTRQGFPSSLFAMLPKLLERAGPGESGTITGLYSVLTEGDGTLDPVAEELQALLDGYVFLSSELARRDHFPAIDILRSRSRLMNAVVTEQHRADAGRIRELLARHAEIELLLRVGEYEKGQDALTDEAVSMIGPINDFLKQDSSRAIPFQETRDHMRRLLDGRRKNTCTSARS